ncbi:DUF4381 domain-containing protein [Photobacterium leiognathi]|uniref:DUF4381 domain-containing protein n=1 Tax=Photobacterium leiognathi TaxID=553611 RepID=UPI002982AAAF|nr:DUF4381 domain-containing protein [Photobacterium leiognathi]
MATPSPQQLPLADIHLPAAPSYWPLAWGWWLALVIVIIVIIALVVMFKRKKQSNAAQKEALNQLALITPEQGLSALNTLLKQAALSYYSRSVVAPLTGEAWLTFLDRQLPVKHSGFVELKTQWLSGTFSNTPLTNEEFEQCKQMTRKWLKHALPPKHATTMAQKESLNV